MEKILYIEQGTDPEETGLKFISKIAQKRNAQLYWLLVAESKEFQSVKEKGEEIASRYAKELNTEKELFYSQIIEYQPSNFFDALNKITPVDLIVANRLDLDVLSSEGIKELEDISLRYKCPVVPFSALMPEEKKSKTRILLRTLIFGGISACIYLLFFPQIDKLNHLIYMKGTVLGALAVMITVPIHAYIYGSFTEGLPKLLGLEKSAGIEH